MGRVAIFAAALLLALPLAGQQQQSSAPAPQQNAPASKPAPSGKTVQPGSHPQKKPSESEQNPFPEAQSEAAAHQAGQNGAATAPSAPAPQPAAPEARPGEADRNPFPESQSAGAAGKDRQPSSSAPAAGSGSSGQDYSSSQSGMPGFKPPLEESPLKAEAGDATTANPAQAKEDTQVGMFYLQTGDYKGAYNRFAEGVKIDPGNADAVFGLAESARHLKLRDEAVRNYQLYLSALPNGPRAKEARKALREMGVAAGS